MVEVEHNGVTYYKTYIDDEKIKGHVAINNKKIIMGGKFAVTLTKGSTKHGDEIQFNVFQTKQENNFKVKERNPSNYNTIEIMIPVKHLTQIIKHLIEAK